MKNVAIVGSTLDALLAAHAATLQGYRVYIFDDGQPIHVDAMALLHDYLPGTDDIRSHPCKFLRSEGAYSEFLQKVFPDVPVKQVVDFLDFEFVNSNGKVTFQLQDPYAITKLLCEMYESRIINNENVGAKWLENIRSSFDHVVIASRKSLFCHAEEDTHYFNAKFVYQVEDFNAFQENTFYMSGSRENGFTISNGLFNRMSVEFSREVPIPKTKLIRPISTNCNCNPDVAYVGALGSWSSRYRLDNVFKNVTELLKD